MIDPRWLKESQRVYVDNILFVSTPPSVDAAPIEAPIEEPKNCVSYYGTIPTAPDVEPSEDIRERCRVIAENASEEKVVDVYESMIAMFRVHGRSVLASANDARHHADMPARINDTSDIEVEQVEPKVKIYVAGASKEPQRVRAAMDLIVALGGKLTLDWLRKIEETGASNECLSDSDRHKYAQDDFGAVRQAQVVWLLASTLSQGAPTELGVALTDAKPTVVSGRDRMKNIFCSLCVEFDSDAEAALYIYNTFINNPSFNKKGS